MANVGDFFLGAEFHTAKVRDANDPVAVLANDQPLELFGLSEVGVGQEIDLDLVAFCAADGC